jgi:hypothetical protein
VEVVLYLSAVISGGVPQLARSGEDSKKADVADHLCAHARCGVTTPQACALCRSES